MTDDDSENFPRTKNFERPDSKRLKSYPNAVRVANLVCRSARRQLVAVVIGTKQNFRVATSAGTSESEGANFLASCRCGSGHLVDGAALRREVLGQHGRGRVPTIYVDTVQRSG